MNKKLVILLSAVLLLTACGTKDENKGELYSIDELNSKEMRKNLSDERIKALVEKKYKKEKINELISIELSTFTKGSEIFTISKDEHTTYFRTFMRDKKDIKVTWEQKIKNDSVSEYFVDSIYPDVTNEKNIIVVGIHRNPNMYLNFFLVGQLEEKEEMEILYDNEIKNNVPIYMGEIKINDGRITISENDSAIYYLIPEGTTIKKKIRNY